MIDELLLLAAYSRKANNIALSRAETDVQIAAGVRADLAKIKRMRAAYEAGFVSNSAQSKIMVDDAERQAKALEAK